MMILAMIIACGALAISAFSMIVSNYRADRVERLCDEVDDLHNSVIDLIAMETGEKVSVIRGPNNVLVLVPEGRNSGDHSGDSGNGGKK